MVVQHDDAVGVCRGGLQALLRVLELTRPDAARLVAPRPHGVEPDHMERRGGIRRLGRLPLVLESTKRAGEACRERVGDVVIAWYCQDGPVEAAEESSGIGELSLPGPGG